MIETLPTQARAIVVTGVAGSGKTTLALDLAAHFGYAFVDADDFHTTEAKTQMAAGVPLSDAQRDPWVGLLQRALRQHAANGRACVMAFSGLRAAHRQRLRESGMPIRFVFLRAAPTLIAARLAGRSGHFMPSALSASQFDALEEPFGEPDVIVLDAGDPPARMLRQAIAALEVV